jgi:hypothetical protein
MNLLKEEMFSCFSGVCLELEARREKKKEEKRREEKRRERERERDKQMIFHLDINDYHHNEKVMMYVRQSLSFKKSS